MKIRFRRDGFPVEIPWPGEGEWTTHKMWEWGTNKCCMSGWLFMAWTGSPEWLDPLDLNDALANPAVNAAARTVSKRAMEMAVARGYGPDRPVVEFNNDPKTTDAMRTAFWAELWGSFGYEECP